MRINNGSRRRSPPPLEWEASSTFLHPDHHETCFDCAFALIASSSNCAYVYSGSNLSIGDYPRFSEWAPSKPYGGDGYAAENYRREVEEYVENARKYIQNVDTDIEDAREKAREAARKANDVVDEYNRWMRDGY